MTASKRMNIYESEDLVIDLEYNDMYAILHLPVMRMTKSTYLAFRNKVDELHELFTDLGYKALWTAIDPEDKTTAKLLNRIGAKKLGSADNLDVYEYTGDN